MSTLIDSVTKTRELTASIFAKALTDIDGLSEIQISQKLLGEIKNHAEIYSEGWYSPPPSGIAVLLDNYPFKRLQYESLRKEESWPKENLFLEKETVGTLYFSPINRETNMIGDIGFTIYKGDNEKIKQHIKNSYSTILEIAKQTKVGMTFSEICSVATNSYKDRLKITKWATTSSPITDMNLGHTVPGSFEKDLVFGKTFEEIKDTIRTKRIAVSEVDHFRIPDTCAFTIESRIEDFKDPDMPSAYFHFIVCFDNGKRTILENYNEIFSVVGMDYMNTK